MDFLLGVLFAVAFFCCLFIAYILGQRSKHPTPQQKKANEEEREKAKKLRKGFDEMMAYNETKATKG